MSTDGYRSDAANAGPLHTYSHNIPNTQTPSNAHFGGLEQSMNVPAEDDKGTDRKGNVVLGGSVVHLQGQQTSMLAKQRSFGTHLPVYGNEHVPLSDEGRRRSTVTLSEDGRKRSVRPTSDSRVEVLPDGTVTINPRGDGDPSSEGEEGGLSDYEGLAEQARIKQLTLKSIRRSIR
jgi:hypothetical protein